MIKLYGFGGFPDLANGTLDASPFVLKIDTYMRMAGIEFETVPKLMHLPKTPKGKMPVIEDDGRVVADSAFILDHFKFEKGFNLDKSLTEEQKAISHAFIKMLDENLYWCLASARYSTDFIFPLLREGFKEDFPLPLRKVGPILFREKLKTQLRFQGLGKHSYQEVVKIAKKDAKALSNLLGDKPFFFGETPTTLDATAFGFLAQFILMTTKDEILLAVSQHKNLNNFCERIYEQYYQ